MASSVRYKPNGSFAKWALKQDFVYSSCMVVARRIAAKANSMYGASGYLARRGSGGKRAHAFVVTGDQHTIRSNHAHNTLLKAMK